MMYVHLDDELFDAAFRPKAMALFCESHSCARGQVGCFWCAAFPLLNWTTRVLALLLAFPEPSPKLCPQRQKNSEPSARFPQACSIAKPSSYRRVGNRVTPATETVLIVTTLSFSVSSAVRRASRSVMTSTSRPTWIAVTLPLNC